MMMMMCLPLSHKRFEKNVIESRYIVDLDYERNKRRLNDELWEQII